MEIAARNVARYHGRRKMPHPSPMTMSIKTMGHASSAATEIAFKTSSIAAPRKTPIIERPFREVKLAVHRGRKLVAMTVANAKVAPDQPLAASGE